MPVTPEGLMAHGMPSQAARYINENVEVVRPVTAVLDWPPGGPYPTPFINTTYTTMADWQNIRISHPDVLTYEDGVLTAHRNMVAMFSFALNFAAGSNQEVQARCYVSSSPVDFAGSIIGAATKDSLSVGGIWPVSEGDTLAVQLLDPAGPSVVVLEESAFSVCGLVLAREI